LVALNGFRLAKSVAAIGILLAVWGRVALALDLVIDIGGRVPSFTLFSAIGSSMGALVWL